MARSRGCNFRNAPPPPWAPEPLLSSRTYEVSLPFSFPGPKICLIITKSLYDGSLSSQAQHPAHPLDVRFLSVPVSATFSLGDVPQPLFLCVSPPAPSLSRPSGTGLAGSSLVRLRGDLGVNSGTWSSAVDRVVFLFGIIKFSDFKSRR